MPSIIRQKEIPTQTSINTDELSKIEIIMPSIIKDINGKINITLLEHILPTRIETDQIIMPQLLKLKPSSSVHDQQ